MFDVNQPFVRLHRAKVDQRCDAIVLDPINHLCRKWWIPMGEEQECANINIRYRFILDERPKKDKSLWAALIDDLPEAYHTSRKKFYRRLATYDCLIASNQKLLDYLIEKIGNKPTILFKGICGKEYYLDSQVLYERRYFQKPRMAFLSHAYTFDVRLFEHPGWEILYFAEQPIHDQTNPDIIWSPYLPLGDYYRKVSDFSPDIIAQDWIAHKAFPYKADMKFRESVIFSSCLLARDPDGIYGIEHGVNGFQWETLEDFHQLLDTIPIETFRAIGRNHRSHELDSARLHGFYQDLTRVYRKWKAT